MRISCSSLLLLAALSTPAHGQTCLKVPPPFLPDLVPAHVLGVPVQFSSDPTGGCRAMYRPGSESQQASRPWAILALEANPDASLGEDGDAVRSRFVAPGHTIHTMAGWPVVMRVAPLGDEFVAYKGSVRVTVLVKNGDQGEGSLALAGAVMESVLPKVPCG